MNEIYSCLVLNLEYDLVLCCKVNIILECASYLLAPDSRVDPGGCLDYAGVQQAEHPVHVGSGDPHPHHGAVP